MYHFCVGDQRKFISIQVSIVVPILLQSLSSSHGPVVVCTWFISTMIMILCFVIHVYHPLWLYLVFVFVSWIPHLTSLILMQMVRLVFDHVQGLEIMSRMYWNRSLHGFVSGNNRNVLMNRLSSYRYQRRYEVVFLSSFPTSLIFIYFFDMNLFLLTYFMS